jgi:hypothetical protein
MKSVFKFIGALIALFVVFAAGILVAKQFLIKDLPPAPTPSLFVGGDGSIELEAFRNGTIHEVHPGDQIQDAVRDAEPGDIIRVFPGVYHETVYVDKDNISFEGIIRDSKWPVLDGKHELNDGFLYSGNFITIENFTIQN